jgi:hypothetical protein
VALRAELFKIPIALTLCYQSVRVAIVVASDEINDSIDAGVGFKFRVFVEFFEFSSCHGVLDGSSRQTNN